MSEPWIKTTRYTRGKLPHWEVEGGRYFVTVRCADSMPASVLTRLSEIQETIANIKARSEDFSGLQRQYFLTMEKYLDAGAGICPLRDIRVARIVVDELMALEEERIRVPHFTIMPNHWHAMIEPQVDANLGLREIMKRVKGRTGRKIRGLIGGSGPFWQREWFDRWMRSETERERCVAYIRNNPVKAGLVSCWQAHHATR